MLWPTNVWLTLVNWVGVRKNNLVGGLEHGFYVSIQLGMSSSQLTNSIIFQRGGSTTSQKRVALNESMDWFKENFTGKAHFYWENLWFPVDFPLTNPLNERKLESSWLVLRICLRFEQILAGSMGEKNGSIRLPETSYGGLWLGFWWRTSWVRYVDLQPHELEFIVTILTALLVFKANLELQLARLTVITGL